MPKTQPLTHQHFERFEQRLAERLATMQAGLRRDIRHDTEELLAEHHRSLTEAITDIILTDKLQALEKRVTALEARPRATPTVHP